MEKQHYKFQLIPLPYDYNALEPYIDALTMELHHDRHLKAYVDNLNNTLANHPEYHSWHLERLIKSANWLPDDIKLSVKRNAGGIYNHEFFFSNMAPNNHQDAVSYEFQHALTDTFGGLEPFKTQFKKEALAVFGSGYAWLVLTKNGNLKIIKTANQDTPLTMNMQPIICIDVWEHAYYLKHYNKRNDYIDDWFHVLSWNKASQNYIDSKLRLS